MGDRRERASKRVAFFCEAYLEGLDVGQTQTRLADISADGAFVDTRAILPVGAIARLRFTLGLREIRTKVEVRYCMEGMGMGLRFVEISDEDRDAIGQFVAEQLT